MARQVCSKAMKSPIYPLQKLKGKQRKQNRTKQNIKKKSKKEKKLKEKKTEKNQNTDMNF